MAAPAFGTPAFWTAVADAMDKARDPVKRYVKDVLDGERAIEKARQESARKAAEDAQRKAELNKKYGEGLATAMARVGTILTSAQNALMSFGGQLTSFVGKANPVAVMHFTQACDNLSAVIGRALTPVLERVTFAIQRLGDAFASLSPTAQSLIGSLSGGAGLAAVFAGVRVAVRALFVALGPIPIIVGLLVSTFGGLVGTLSSGKLFAAALDRVLQAVGTIFEALASVVVPLVVTALEWVTPLLETLADALTSVGEVIGDVLESIGLATAAKYDPKARSATGAAVRPAQIGDISSFASKAYTSAMSGSTADVPKQSLDVLKEIRDELKAKRADGRDAAGRATHPFETGSDGKTNFGRGMQRISDNLWGKEGADGKTNTRRGFDTLADDYNRGGGRAVINRLATLLD